MHTNEVKETVANVDSISSVRLDSAAMSRAIPESGDGASGNAADGQVEMKLRPVRPARPDLSK